MKFISENAQLARSGHSVVRGFLSVGALCSIPHRNTNRPAPVFYKNQFVGYMFNLNFVDLRNGAAELRGDITFDCESVTANKLIHDELYPVIAIATSANPNYIYLSEVHLSTKDEREFEDQKPVDLSGLRHLVHGITEPKRDTKQDLTINITVDDSEISEEERQKILSDIKELTGKPEITFDEKGRYDGEGLMRYGHYRNGALMGYVTVRASTWGADFNSQDLPYILEKFIEHQRNKWGEATNRWSFDEM